MKKRSLIIFALLLSCLMIIAGCGDSKTEKDTKQQETKVATQAEKPAAVNNEFTLYFPDENGEYLIPSKHRIDVTEADQYKEVVAALIKGPDNAKEGIAIMPKGTNVIDVKVTKGIANVDFNQDFVKHFPGGSTSELMIIGSIVNTLTDIKGIDAVKISVEGKGIDTLSGHLDLSEPLKPMKDLIKK